MLRVALVLKQHIDMSRFLVDPFDDLVKQIGEMLP